MNYYLAKNEDGTVILYQGESCPLKIGGEYGGTGECSPIMGSLPKELFSEVNISPGECIILEEVDL
jgi:hypothetical protein